MVCVPRRADLTLRWPFRAATRLNQSWRLIPRRGYLITSQKIPTTAMKPKVKITVLT